jgi:phosphate-selective porin
VLGPLSFQAEYYGTLVDQPGQPTVFLHGAYAYVSYFLTGENRVYDPIQGIYVATRPYSEFFACARIAASPRAPEHGRSRPASRPLI